MKNLMFIYVLLCTSIVFASEYTSVNFYPSTWDSEKICQQLSQGQDCFEIVESVERYSVKQIEVDDLLKPVYSEKSEVVSCNGQVDCYSKNKVVCGQNQCDRCQTPAEFFVNNSFTEAYCSTRTGYLKKSKLAVVLDSAKESSYLQSKQQKDLLKLKKQAILAKEKNREKGQTAIAMIQASETKDMSVLEKKQFITKTKPVIEALSIGSIDVAISLINDLPTDEQITQQAKTEILTFLNN